MCDKLKKVTTYVLLGLVILVVVFMCSCGQKHNKKDVPEDKTLQLTKKYELYQRLFEAVSDKNGFIATEHCDSLMYSSLANPNINLQAAEIEPGKWLRRPTDYPECFSSGESKSNISRDGLVGVIYRSLKNKDVAMLKRMWDYGQSHNWVMGQDGWQHSVFTPDYIALLAQALYKTSDGKYDYIARVFTFPKMVPALPGYTSQLQAIYIKLKDELYNTYNGDIARKLFDQNKINPLLAIIADDKEAATDLLLQTWPEDRLPTSHDWCADWLLDQASNGNGRNPCLNEDVTHSGGDFLFVTRLVLNLE